MKRICEYEGVWPGCNCSHCLGVNHSPPGIHPSSPSAGAELHLTQPLPFVSSSCLVELKSRRTIRSSKSHVSFHRRTSRILCGSFASFRPPPSGRQKPPPQLHALSIQMHAHDACLVRQDACSSQTEHCKKKLVVRLGQRIDKPGMDASFLAQATRIATPLVFHPRFRHTFVHVDRHLEGVPTCWLARLGLGDDKWVTATRPGVPSCRLPLYVRTLTLILFC
ncbi:hypothetical protein B0J13DRAFT_157033 [Dactylonectria estremocensis]|uniref:Uncharacterized protein n=1 Tax=Dactylonectria estremocensis TaxID=1079267 RepID=A0A9P9DNH2_9HYPO|nr:hypothetical protein B0J13DRAFT_157033 [Dactylonectria estremocensis]